jgi:hypothetical protein
MKRTAIARRTPLRSTSTLARNTRIKPRRERERRSSRVHDEKYLDTCRSSRTPGVRCAYKRLLGAAIDACFGPVEPDHLRDMTGTGMKASDVHAAPACRNHHDQAETFKLRGAETGDSRKALRRSAIALHHADLRRAGHPAAPLLITPAASAA